jgi:predicted nucleotidyltransferase
MPSLCRFDPGRGPALYAEIDAKLELLARSLRQRYRIDRIILHGSYARREVHEGSDIDLIVVGDFPLRFHERPSLVREMSDLPLEPLCYTPAEFAALINTGNPFIAEVLSEGREL